MRERIGKKTKVPRDKSLDTEDYLRERRKNQQREQDAEAERREKFFGEVVAAGLLHAQIKTGGGVKCNRAQLTLSLAGLTLFTDL